MTRESEDALKRAVRQDSTYARAWFALGHLYRENGDPAASIEMYERGLRHAPYRLDILRILSETYLRAGRTAEAIRMAERGLEAAPGSHELHFTLGCIHMVNQDYDKAIVSLGSALEVRPRDGRYAYSLAGAYYARGDHDGAMKYARMAQKLGYDSGDLIDMIQAASGGVGQ
jgi:tetratricopeptide (TPR) repeat protein